MRICCSQTTEDRLSRSKAHIVLCLLMTFSLSLSLLYLLFSLEKSYSFRTKVGLSSVCPCVPVCVRPSHSSHVAKGTGKCIA